MKQYDVIGIGNAITDILFHTYEDFLHENNISKDNMTLIDKDKSDSLYKNVQTQAIIAGGACVNSLVGVVSFGGKAAFIGKIGGDDIGSKFKSDLAQNGVDFLGDVVQGSDSGRCYVAITSGAKRSMATYLGVASNFSMADLDLNKEYIASAKILYLEGYLLYGDENYKILIEAAKIAQSNGTKLAISFADSLCVRLNKDKLAQLVEYSDIIFRNEAEMQEYNLPISPNKIVVTTKSSKGSVIEQNGKKINIEAIDQPYIVDLTGAGDIYASGVLYGLTHNKTLEECGRLGSLAAADIISQYGTRPTHKFSKFIA